MVVQALMSEHGMSERRACQASGIARSTLRYRPAARDDSGVITFIQAHMALNPRHGFGLLYDSARYQGKPQGVYALSTDENRIRKDGTITKKGETHLAATTLSSWAVDAAASDTSVNGHNPATTSALCRVWRRNFGKPYDPCQSAAVIAREGRTESLYYSV